MSIYFICLFLLIFKVSLLHSYRNDLRVNRHKDTNPIQKSKVDHQRKVSVHHPIEKSLLDSPEPTFQYYRPRKRVTNPFIISGRPARPGELPYQLNLIHNGVHLCGATLVMVGGRQTVVTAAHCVSQPGTTTQLPIQSFKIEAGSLSRTGQSGQILDLSKIVIHPQFEIDEEYAFPLKNDIAVLHLMGDFTLGDNVKPIGLPSSGSTPSGSVTVSGWGKVDYDDDDFSEELLLVQLPVTDFNTCESNYMSAFAKEVVFTTSFCAGNGNGDSCEGDSGGPAVDSGGVLVGVTSWGYGCNDARFPGIFTKVADYVGWIETA